MQSEITLWFTKLLLCNPDVLFLNILFMLLYVWIHFLIIHILWAIFQSHLYSSVLDLVGLSVNLLYATFFSCTAILHSSSNHLLLSGFGCYPTVCSAVSSFLLNVSILHLHGPFLPTLILSWSFQILLLVVVGH